MTTFSEFADWNNKDKIISVFPKQKMPPSLNGIPFTNLPKISDWANVAGQKKIHETELKNPHDLRLGSGCIVIEPDGRIWIAHPTNQFGGYHATFPKGGLEDGLSLQANAIKETYEEIGLMVRITGVALDVTRTTSVARYYYAERVGGNPAQMGWESEKVSLVPKRLLSQELNHAIDKRLAASI